MTLGVLGVVGIVGEHARSPDASASSLAASTPAHLTLPSHGTYAFADGPPARVTGGFGEDSCFACHWDGAENEGPGELSVTGFPESIAAGESHRITVRLTQSEMEVAGFQMAVRLSNDTTQAGALEVPEEEMERVRIIEERAILFAQHSLDGTELTSPGAAEWTVLWTPPPGEEASVLHISAVAGDGDRSQMGDHVYTLELESRPEK